MFKILLKIITKTIKKLQIILLKNIKIVISVLLSISLSSLICYLDFYDLNFFNKKEIMDLKTELLELKEELNFEEKEDLNFKEKENLSLEENNKKDYIYKYIIGGVFLIIGGLFLYYYFHGGNKELSLEDSVLKPSLEPILDPILKEISQIEKINSIENPEIRSFEVERFMDENEAKYFYDKKTESMDYTRLEKPTGHLTSEECKELDS